MYICNDQDVELNIPMTDAISLARVITSYCGWSQSKGWSFDSISGQVYTDNDGGEMTLYKCFMRLLRLMMTLDSPRL